MEKIILVIVILVVWSNGILFAKSSEPSLESIPVLMPGGEGGTGFDDMNFSPNLHKVLVPGGRTGKLYLIDSRTKAISTVDGFSAENNYPGGHGQSITSADEGEGFIFTTDRNSLRINAVTLQSKTVVASSALASGPDYVRFVDSTHEVWVTQPGRERIEIFTFLAKSKSSLVPSGFIDVPGGPESLIIDHARQRAYTHLWEGKTVAIDLQSHAIIGQWLNGCSSSRGIALDEKHGFLFAGCAEGKAIVMDINKKGMQISSLMASPGVDVISYNSKLQHLYLASDALWAIGVSDQGKLSLLGTAKAAEGTHCVTGDDQDNIWVCDPQHGQLLFYKDRF